MKWAAIFLCLLGVMAAACAAFLVKGLSLPSAIETRIAAAKAEDTAEVQVLFATRTIPAMTVVDSRLVTLKSMPRNKAPADYISNTVEVVGKVLARPVVEGQSFSLSCFAGDSASRLVAEAIPKGKRAVGISVSDYAGLEGMLYPGSTVDVLASFKAQGASNIEWKNASTITLLENVQVLGIEQQTVVSPGKTMNDGAGVGRNTRRVTLLVDTKQAKSLQLAMENGTLSLAMRNPMDVGPTNKTTVSARELMGEPAETPQAAGPSFGDKLIEVLKQAAANKEHAPTTQESSTLFGGENRRPQWEVEVIRGKDVETKSFEVPKEAKEASGEVAAKPEK